MCFGCFIVKSLRFFKKNLDHRFAAAVVLNFSKQRTCHTIGDGWYSFSIKPNVSKIKKDTSLRELEICVLENILLKVSLQLKTLDVNKKNVLISSDISFLQ